MKLTRWFALLLFTTGSNTTSGSTIVASYGFLLKAVSITNDPPRKDLLMSTVRAVKPPNVKAKVGVRQKLLTVIINSKLLRRLARIDEPIENQLRLGRLSLIFSLAAVGLVVLAAVVTIPAILGAVVVPLSVAGFVLGIKSIRGNTNVMGLIGLVLSSALILLMILAVILFVILLREWL